MHLQVLLPLIFIAVNAADDDHDILSRWKTFQVEFKKQYRSPLDAQRRLSIFKNNVKKIDAHNILFDEGKVSYQMEINKFADTDFNEIVKRNDNDLERISGTFATYNKSENFKLPASIDWREKNIVSSVRNEGDCIKGSYAISTAGAIEGQWALKTGNLVPLSPQNLIDCSSSEGNWGCAGGSRLFAYDYVQKYGIESEEDYPFVRVKNTCYSDSSKTVTKISKYISITRGDEEALQQAIVTQGPISAGMDATGHLRPYKSGIFDDNLCGHYSMNHNILIVGFGTENDKDYYIIKNSWGANWGESGYFRLARNEGNKCAIAGLAGIPRRYSDYPDASNMVTLLNIV